ncbi:MAG: hypothetical protein K8E66_03325, partial [Phycisphaerales bacterium]|nr:hypothetical protein [Phycisphaerales bacterium]
MAGETAGHDATTGRRTSVWVRVQDRAAAVVITSGGLAVLLAMLGICLFLVTSVAPLFVGGRVTGEISRFGFENGPPVWVTLEPAFDRFVTFEPDGVFRVRAINDGRVLAERSAFENGTIPVMLRAEAGDGWLTATLPDDTFEIVRAALSWEPAGASVDPVDGDQHS